MFYLISFWPLTDEDRKKMFIALLITSGLGTLSFLFLRKSSQEEEEDFLHEEEGQPLLSSRLMYGKSSFKHFFSLLIIIIHEVRLRERGIVMFHLSSCYRFKQRASSAIKEAKTDFSKCRNYSSIIDVILSVQNTVELYNKKDLHSLITSMSEMTIRLVLSGTCYFSRD